MTRKKNPHIGSTFESWLDEAGLRAHNAKPVAVMLQPFNQEPTNSGAMTGFTDLTPGR